MEVPKPQSDKILLMKISHLTEDLHQKAETIENYENQFKKLYEDFNYNVELIYERDRDIEALNKKLEQKNILLAQREKEIQLLKEQVARAKVLEQENFALNKKLEGFLGNNSQRPDSRTPKLDYKNLLKDKSTVVAKPSYLNSYHKAEKSANRSECSLEATLNPLNELNFDLESRIKALEVENSGKDRKTASLNNSRVNETSMELDSEVFDARQKVKKQEKEVSELIRSLQVYKKQSEVGSGAKLKVYDEQIVALNEDIRRLKKNESLEVDDKRYRQMVRPRSNMDKRVA